MSDRYDRPRVVVVGDVRDVTLGNRVFLPDEHWGQATVPFHFDTVDTTFPLPRRV
jgi:hypothetical protein